MRVRTRAGSGDCKPMAESLSSLTIEIQRRRRECPRWKVESETPRASFPSMSTVAEIQEAIAKLPPEDFCAIQEWMTKGPDGSAWRKWTSEELVERARRMVAEPDPERAKLLKEEIMRGF